MVDTGPKEVYSRRNRAQHGGGRGEVRREIGQPGGVSEGDVGGNQEGRSWAFYSNKRCVKWCPKSPEIKSTKRATVSCIGRELRP